MEENNIDIPFAIETGMSSISIPYTNHKDTPAVSIKYIAKERSAVCFVFIVLITCGKKEIETQIPAMNPIISIKSIK